MHLRRSAEANSRAVANEPPHDWKVFLGRKVSIRFQLEDDPRHEFSEAIGVIQSVTDADDGQRIEIVKRRGQVVSVSARHILAAKMWP
jgi:hypothetical protein